MAPHKGPSFIEARQQKALIDPGKVELPPYYPDHPVVRDEVANYLDAVQLLDHKVVDGGDAGQRRHTGAQRRAGSVAEAPRAETVSSIARFFLQRRRDALPIVRVHMQCPLDRHGLG